MLRDVKKRKECQEWVRVIKFNNIHNLCAILGIKGSTNHEEIIFLPRLLTYYCLCHESHFVTKLRKERHFLRCLRYPFWGWVGIDCVKEQKKMNKKLIIVIEYCYHYRFVIFDMPTHFFPRLKDLSRPPSLIALKLF